MSTIDIGTAGFLVAGLVALVLLIFIRFKEVPQDERWVIEMFGKYARTLKPGLNIIIAGLEKIRSRQSTREFVMPFNVEGTITKDGITISEIMGLLRVILNLDGDPKEAAKKATYALKISDEEIPKERVLEKKVEERQAQEPQTSENKKKKFVPEGPIEIALDGLADSTVRGIIGSQEFEFILNHQKELRDLMVEAMMEDINRWGQILIRLDITEVIPPPDLAKKLRAPFEARKDGEATVIRGRAEGDAEEAKAKGQATAAVRLAEARKQAAIEVAQGEATARELEATSKAGVLKSLTEACGGNVTTAIDFMFGEETIEAVKSLGQGQGTIIVPAGVEGMATIAAMFNRATKTAASGTPAPTVPVAEPSTQM